MNGHIFAIWAISICALHNVNTKLGMRLEKLIEEKHKREGKQR